MGKNKLYKINSNQPVVLINRTGLILICVNPNKNRDIPLVKNDRKKVDNLKINRKQQKKLECCE